jgi:uncharacterized protein (TIGR02594 family)
MWEAIKAPFRDDETAWCSAYVGACLERAGIRSTRSAAARSYMKWGVAIEQPVLGCVVVFWRGSKNGWSGHVGFVVGKQWLRNAQGVWEWHLVVLGGNQGDAVNTKAFPVSRVLGYRLPSYYPVTALGFQSLPSIATSKTISEA